jgi:hypothetical protein
MFMVKTMIIGGMMPCADSRLSADYCEHMLYALVLESLLQIATSVLCSVISAAANAMKPLYCFTCNVRCHSNVNCTTVSSSAVDYVVHHHIREC